MIRRWFVFAFCVLMEALFVYLMIQDFRSYNDGQCALAAVVASLFAGAALLSAPEVSR